MVNSRAPEIAIYLRTYLRASFQRKALMHYEQTEYIAATKFAWIVVFNGSEASEPLTNGRARRCIKSLKAKRGVRANPLEPPPAYRPDK